MKLLGKIIYWLGWPLLYLVLNNSTRTRVIVKRKNEVLVVYPVVCDGRWILPGGGVRKGELLVDSAVRELFEETRLVVSPYEMREISREVLVVNRIKTHLVFFACDLIRAEVIRPHKIEINDYKWVDQHQLSELSMHHVEKDNACRQMV